MSRHGYVDDYDEPQELAMYRGQVASAIRGRRGQAFLRELAAAMDAMPEKVLIANELMNEDGDCCAIGVVCKARGVDVSSVDYGAPEQVAALVNVAEPLAREVAYHNDEHGERYEKVVVPKPEGSQWHPGFTWHRIEETPAERWQRMRRWVEKQIKPTE